MDNRERYERLVQLSDFYVKNIKPRLEVFNKAIFISNISLTGFWIMFLAIIGFFACCALASIFNGFSKLAFMDWIAPTAFIAIFVFGAIYGLLIMPKLEKMDRENDIHVFKYSSTRKNSVTLPTSADNEIKKLLMSDFLQVFDCFSWRQYMPKNFRQDYSFIRSLKILNNVYFTFDDCIEGKYKEVNIEIKELNSSFFQRMTLVYLFILVFVCMILSSVPIAMIPVILFSVLFKFFPLFLKLIFVFVILPCLYLIILSFCLKMGGTLFFNKRFRGVVVSLDMNKNFEGQTIILEKGNFSEKRTAIMNGFEQVKLEDVEFAKEYEVFSKNQIEARYLLTTAFIDRLNNLKAKYKAKYIRVSFVDKKIVIAIHTDRDMFKMADMISQTSKETFVQLFDEIVSVLDLVDTLKLNSKIGL